MQAELLEVMRDQACAIYRAVTGTEMPEPETRTAAAEAPLDEVTRSFAELEAMARTVPVLAGRIPPFSFTPSLDAVWESDGLTIEVALPGVEGSDFKVEVTDEMLIISGIRRGPRGSRAGVYSHAEIPRGPFHRAFRLPFTLAGTPAVQLDRGLLRIRLEQVSGNGTTDNGTPDRF